MEFNLGIKDSDLEGLSDEELGELAEQGRRFIKAEEAKIIEALKPHIRLENSSISPRQFWFEEAVWRNEIASGKINWVQLETAQEAKLRAVTAESIVATLEQIIYTHKEHRARMSYLHGEPIAEDDKEEGWIF